MFAWTVNAIAVLLFASCTVDGLPVCNGKIHIYHNYDAGTVKPFKNTVQFFQNKMPEEVVDVKTQSRNVCVEKEFQTSVSNDTTGNIVILLSDRMKQPCNLLDPGSAVIQIINDGGHVSSLLDTAGTKRIRKLDLQLSRYEMDDVLKMIVTSVSHKSGCKFATSVGQSNDPVFKKQSNKKESGQGLVIPSWLIVVIGAAGIVVIVGVIAVLAVQGYSNKRHYEAVQKMLESSSKREILKKPPPVSTAALPVSTAALPPREIVGKQSEFSKVSASFDKDIDNDELASCLSGVASFCSKMAQIESKKEDASKGAELKFSSNFEFRDRPTNLNIILKEFGDKILPAMPKWKHPYQFSHPSGVRIFNDVAAEALCDGLEAYKCIVEDYSDFSNVEETVVTWMGEAIGLPSVLLSGRGGGFILSSSLASFITAVIASRYRAMRVYPSEINETGFKKLVAYASSESDPAFEEACRIAGVQYKIIPAIENRTFNTEQLVDEIKKDLNHGFRPFYVHATLGTFATNASDDIYLIGLMTEQLNIWLHVDGGRYGNLMICPENRNCLKGIEHADSFNIDTTKLMGASSATIFWTKHKGIIRASFLDVTILKRQYFAKTTGRREVKTLFKPLKVFVMMMLTGLQIYQEQIRKICKMAARMRSHVKSDPRLEIIESEKSDYVSFRLKGSTIEDSNEKTRRLCMFINKSGKILVSRTFLDGIYAIRLFINRENADRTRIDEAWTLIKTLISQWWGEEKNGKAARETNACNIVDGEYVVPTSSAAALTGDLASSSLENGSSEKDDWESSEGDHSAMVDVDDEPSQIAVRERGPKAADATNFGEDSTLYRTVSLTSSPE